MLLQPWYGRRDIFADCCQLQPPLLKKSCLSPDGRLYSTPDDVISLLISPMDSPFRQARRARACVRACLRARVCVCVCVCVCVDVMGCMHRQQVARWTTDHDHHLDIDRHCRHGNRLAAVKSHRCHCCNKWGLEHRVRQCASLFLALSLVLSPSLSLAFSLATSLPLCLSSSLLGCCALMHEALFLRQHWQQSQARASSSPAFF
jgi:hypothetical protein